MNVIDKTTRKVFASIDHATALAEAQRRELIMVGSTVAPEARVAPLEPIVFGHLTRSIDTGTAMSLGLVLSRNRLNLAAIEALAQENLGVVPVVRARVSEYLSAFDRLRVLTQHDREEALAQLAQLAERL